MASEIVDTENHAYAVGFSADSEAVAASPSLHVGRLLTVDELIRTSDAKKQLAGAPLDSVVLVGGSTRIPLIRRRVAEFFGLEPYTALDPDRVVAMGAAVQAGILSGAATGSLLLDVIPLSLGIETAGGAVAKVIHRNATVPAPGPPCLR